MAKTYKIHPAIGIARTGNSPDSFFIGPEKPGEIVSADSLPAGGLKDFRYKDAQFRVKRQAARFRIFEYGEDGKPGKEIKLTDEDVESISWTVELANLKTWYRNKNAFKDPVNDPQLRMEPGPVPVSTPDVKVPIQFTFSPTSFKFKNKTVLLGEAQVEATGRLIVLSGLGQAASDPEGDDLIDNENNRHWQDDIADGLITAKIKLKSTGQTFDAAGAWVVVGPPDFAPPLRSVTTLYDLLFQRAIDASSLKKPEKVSFVDDIYPILRRAFDLRWTTSVITNVAAHSTFAITSENAEAAKVLCDAAHGFARSMIFKRLRNPDPQKFPEFTGGDMPFLMNSDGDPGLTLTRFQYEMFMAWANKAEGADNSDGLVSWVRDSIAAPLSLPEQLDRTALESCVGGAFAPGFEVDNLIASNAIKGLYIEPFRLTHDKTTLKAGDLTKEMSLPWQADFMSCRRHPDIKQNVPWWPSHRPDDVFTEEDQNSTQHLEWIRDIVRGPVLKDEDNKVIITPDNPKGRRIDRLTMTARWHLLGFVIKRDDKYPETERNPTIKWKTTHLNFDKVPEGYSASRPVDIEISSSMPVTFKVANGLKNPANFTFPEQEITIAASGPSKFNKGRLWITYTSAQTGALSDELTIQVLQKHQPCAEDYCLLGQQVIPIQAETVAREKSATMLVLDRSGSMGEIVLGNQKKIDVLRSAAKTFVDLALKDDGIGIAGYNHEAAMLMDVTKVGLEGSNDEARQALKNKIDSDELVPSGETSIGSGLIIASEAIKLASKNDYALSSFIVLTDGKENHDPLIDSQAVSDALSQSVKSNRVYAIGLGQPEDINQSKLDQLTQSSPEHEGALLITGDLSLDDNQFRLKKYFIQILANVNNTQIVLDPQGELEFGSEIRIPFHITGADIGMDVILLSGSPRALAFNLETPAGEIIGTAGQEAQTPALKFVLGEEMSFYRLFFDASSQKAVDRAGLWHAVLSFGDNISEKAVGAKAANVASIPYSLIVHAYSNLRLKASAPQLSYQPGAEILLQTSLTEYDIPLAGRSRVWAEITDPQGERTRIDLAEVEPGQFAASMHAEKEGVYQARIRATGTTLQDDAFSREQTLTPAVSREMDGCRVRRGCLPALVRRIFRY